MNLSICSLLFAVFGLQVAVSLRDTSQFCPDFTATFTTVIDQTFEGSNFVMNDPQKTYFKEILGFTDEDIEHAFEDAFKFFNDTYGLDFSLSQPNEQNEYFTENAKLSLYRLDTDLHYRLALNNWIQTGNTRSTCRDAYDGGFHVTFSADQLLHGSYGGADGIPIGVGENVNYGFSKINVCDQSPMIIQFQTATPFRHEPVDGTTFLNFDLYDRVLGRGKALGAYTVKPDTKEPGKYRIIARVVYTFPAL